MSGALGGGVVNVSVNIQPIQVNARLNVTTGSGAGSSSETRPTPETVPRPVAQPPQPLGADAAPLTLAQAQPARLEDFGPLQAFPDLRPRQPLDQGRPQEIEDLSPAELHEFRPVEVDPALQPQPFPDLRPQETLSQLQLQEIQNVRPGPLTDPPEPDLYLSHVNLPGAAAYIQPIRPLLLEASIAEAYRNTTIVSHTYEHQPMSHYHYHYQAVPVDDIPPPRNRNVHLPVRGPIINVKV